MNENNVMEPKDCFKMIGLVFATLFGILFTIIYFFSIVDNIVYTVGYTHYDGKVKEVKVVESYISTTTKYHKTSSGHKTKTVEKTTKYKQDIVVSFNGREAKIDDTPVDKKGYMINDDVSIYVSNMNKDKVKIHADISDRAYLIKFLAFIGGYWTIYIFAFKRMKKKILE